MIAEASLKNLIPLISGDPRQKPKQKGCLNYTTRLRIAERIARKLDKSKLPLDVHLIKRAYEKDGVLMKVADKLYPNATPEKENGESTSIKIEVLLERGTSNIQDKTPRQGSERNCITIEAGTMSCEQSA